MRRKRRAPQRARETAQMLTGDTVADPTPRPRSAESASPSSSVCGASARGCAPTGDPPVPIPAARPAIFYGWVIVATTFLIALVTVGGRSAFGVFVVPMSEAFGWSRSTISFAAALGFLVNGLGQPFVGRLLRYSWGTEGHPGEPGGVWDHYGPPGADVPYSFAAYGLGVMM